VMKQVLNTRRENLHAIKLNDYEKLLDFKTKCSRQSSNVKGIFSLTLGSFLFRAKHLSFLGSISIYINANHKI
jgi:hypothetical protein